MQALSVPAMHIAVIKSVQNGRVHHSKLLRSSFRDDQGRVQKRTLANLSHLPDTAIDLLRAHLAGCPLVDPAAAFALVRSRSHGSVRAVLEACRRLGLAQLVGSRPSPQRALVAARILQPHSRLATARWWHATTLPDHFDVRGTVAEDPHAAMDWLLQRQRFGFERSSELLSALSGVRVETKQVECTAKALGRQIADDERAVLDPATPPPAPTMYVGMDGTGFPMRSSEVIGRGGKQPDGTAKTREGKLATVWPAEGRDPVGRPVRDPGSVSDNAAVESVASPDTDSEPSAFAQRVYREAQRRGFTSAARPVVIGDGAHWIWNLAAEQFPGAVEIVDIYHAKQHLHDVAKAREDELDTGRLRALVRALRAARSMPRPWAASATWSGTATGCAILSSAPKACVSPRGSSRPDANSSAPASSAPACAGPWTAPTPSSLSTAVCSAGDTRTSGSDEPRKPHDSDHIPDVHPVDRFGSI